MQSKKKYDENLQSSNGRSPEKKKTIQNLPEQNIQKYSTRQTSSFIKQPNPK